MTRFLVWIGALAVAFALLVWLGRPSGTEIPWTRVGSWLDSAPPEVVAAACLRLVAIALVVWLLVSSVLYAAVRLMRLSHGAGVVRRFTVPVVQRWVNRLAFAGMAVATTAGVCSQLAVVGEMTRLPMAAAAEAPVTDGTGPPDGEIEGDGDGWWPLRPSAEDDGSEPPGAGGSPRPDEPVGEPRDAIESDGRSDGSSGIKEEDDADEATSRGSAGTGGSEGTADPQRSSDRLHAGQAPEDGSVPGPSDRSGALSPGGGVGSAAPGADYIVQPGDSLWSIAARALAQAAGRHEASLASGEIAPYWLQVIDANRARLRSGDPDLIFPAEGIHLPEPQL